MISNFKFWYTSSQLDFGQGSSLLLKLLKGLKNAISTRFTKVFLGLKKTQNNSLAYEESSSMLFFVFLVCFATEKNSSPGASRKTSIVVLVTLHSSLEFFHCLCLKPPIEVNFICEGLFLFTSLFTSSFFLQYSI
jgi:hypothetical protein